MPLLAKNEYFKSSSDVSFTYKEVEYGIMHMPKYITWDNVIDVFLTKQYKTSLLENNVKGGNYKNTNNNIIDY